jgi:hypothetical protein
MNFKAMKDPEGVEGLVNMTEKVMNAKKEDVHFIRGLLPMLEKLAKALSI